jgi:adenine-specific DNA-methyltransferase
MDGKTLDVRMEQQEKLKALFPEALSEGKIDWEKLRLTLGEELILQNERYVLNWAGKSDAFRAIQTHTTATLKPKKDQSINFDTTENIFIEGENLEVLKVLQKSYYGKIKMIYIDPPYNTGNDSFIYPDKFSESKDDYLKRIGDKDEAGYLTKEGFFRKNSKENGQYHSNWLSMMYPRLFLARNLLRDDGVIFVSIDDNEVHNLRLLMNEVFGEENFIAEIVWKRKTGSGSQIDKVFSEHEYLIVYGKNEIVESKWRIMTEGDGNFKNPDNDTRGPWESCAITAPSKNRNPNQLYMIEVFFNDLSKIKADQVDIIDKFEYLGHSIILRKVEENTQIEEHYSEENNYARFVRRWAYIPSSMKDIFGQKRVFFNRGNLPRYKKFEYEYEGKALRSIYFNEFSTQMGTEQLRNLLGFEAVEYPKPVQLISTLIKAISKNSDDIVLDFFAGSGTTAQSVLESNQDAVNRKFILAQLPEKTEEDSEAYKAGYKTIADICKERIRRVIDRIKNEGDRSQEKDKQKTHSQLSFPNASIGNPEQDKRLDARLQSAGMTNSGLDLGFKVYTLEPSNFKIWRTDVIDNEEDLKRQMNAFVDPARAGAEVEAMSWEILLKSGYELTTKLEKVAIAGASVFSIAGGELLLALENITQEAIDNIIAKKPKKVIALDRLFAGNDQLKTNTVLQMKDAGIEFRTI